MRLTLSFILFALLFPAAPLLAADKSETTARQRQAMIAAIEADVRDTSRLIDRQRLRQGVMEAMATVPRHEFVPKSQVARAYENRPLPIGHGQTISQPYIVALMTDLVDPEPGDRVLEIGTGSGYQAAILSSLVSEVYSIEIIRELGEEATERLKRLGYGNVRTRIADGYDGWPSKSPFDGIIVTAAISHIPPPLVRQLKPGGRMVIPVGTRFQTQTLTIVEKASDGTVTTRQVLPVRFVPFTGGHR